MIDHWAFLKKIDADGDDEVSIKLYDELTHRIDIPDSGVSCCGILTRYG